MEPCSVGGGRVTDRLEEHLVVLREATRKWLEYENPAPAKPKSSTRLLDDPVFEQADEQSSPPEQPETLAWIRRANRLRLPLFAGDIWDAPYVMMREVEVVTEEIERMEGIKADRALKAMQQNATQQPAIPR